MRSIAISTFVFVLLAIASPTFAQVMYVEAGPLGGSLGPVFDIGAGQQFNVAVTLDTFGEGSSAAEFVMTELLIVAPGVFKLGTVKVNNTPLDLGDNAVGEYVLSFQGCVAGGAPVTMVTLTYGTFGGPVPPDTVLSLRGLQPGDSVGSTHGGELGYIDCSDGGFVAHMGGTPGGMTGSGVLFPDGSAVINPTPPISPAPPSMITWEIAEGGNGNTYRAVFSDEIGWNDARVAAAGLEFEGVNGSLASLSSPAEAAWVASTFGDSGDGYWLGGLQSIDDLPDQNWRWITNDEWVAENWAPGQPDGDPWTGADFLYADNSQGGQWVASQNNRTGASWYLVEFPRTAKFEVVRSDLPNEARAVAWTRLEKGGEYHAYLTRRGVPNQLVTFVTPDSLVLDTHTVLADPGDGFSTLWFEMGEHSYYDAYVMNGASEGAVIYNYGQGAFFPFLAFPDVDDAFSRVAVAMDPDGDRDLDLIVGRIGSQPDRFMQFGERNFADMTPPEFQAPVTTTAIAPADYDNDGDLDVYFVRWGSANTLMRNDGAGAWTDVTPSLLADTGDGTSAAWGDFDNDGLMDLALTNSTGACRLYRNLGADSFEDVTPSGMLGENSNGNASWIDFDNDGWLDLFYTRGPGSDRLWQNAGGELVDIKAPGLDHPGNHAGAAWADFDGDGDLDVLQAEYDSTSGSRLIRNLEDTGYSWLELDLVGVESNEDGIGARVRAVTGQKSQIRDLILSAGNKSQNISTLHFGFGEAAVIDSLIIRWPSGFVQVGTDVAVNDHITVWEGGSFTAAPNYAPSNDRAWLSGAHPNPFNPTTTIYYGMTQSGHVDLTIYDLAGRRVKTLISDHATAGDHEVSWDGRDNSGKRVASGVYLYRLVAGEFRDTKRMVLLK